MHFQIFSLSAVARALLVNSTSCPGSPSKENKDILIPVSDPREMAWWEMEMQIRHWFLQCQCHDHETVSAAALDIAFGRRQEPQEMLIYCILVCLLSWLWAPLRRVWPCRLYHHPHQVLIHIDKVSLSVLFPRLNNPSSISLSLYIRCSNPLIFFMALCWTPSNMSMSLLFWLAQHWTQDFRCFLPVLSRRKATCWQSSA